MNNRGYHMQYRGAYRRKRIKLIIAVSAIALVFLAVLFLMIGTALNNKTHTSSGDFSNNSNDTADQSKGEDNTLAEAKHIKGRPLVLLTQDTSTIASRMQALPKGTEAVCVALNQADGTLLYNSAVAGKTSFLKVAENASRATTVFSNIHNRGYYISAALTVTSLAESDALSRELGVSAYVAIAAEAAMGGADDILLIAPSNMREMTEEGLDAFVEELVSIAKRIRTLAPEAVVGFALDNTFLSAKDSAALIDRLAEGFNYLGINATGYGKEDPLEFLERTVGSSETADVQYYLLRYNMRVILPNLEDATARESLISVVEDYSSNNGNWQFLP